MNNVYSTLIEYEDSIGRDISIEEAINVLYEDVKKRERNLLTNAGLASTLSGGLFMTQGKLKDIDLDKKIKSGQIGQASDGYKQIPGLKNGKWYSNFREWIEKTFFNHQHEMTVKNIIDETTKYNKHLTNIGITFSLSGLLLMILGVLYHHKKVLKDKTKETIIDKDIQNTKKAIQQVQKH